MQGMRRAAPCRPLRCQEACRCATDVRFPLMALGLLALLTVLWGGLVRLGWPWPVPLPTLFMAHGPLMVCGFLGTLIGVERAMVMCPVSAACLV